MKKHYSIGEIAALYSMGADSLRYYEEIGLISPVRGGNGYREYGTDDIWRLNIIRDMLKLDYTTAEIKEYLDNRTVASTLELFRHECEIIDAQIRELTDIRDKVMLRETGIARALKLDDLRMAIRRLPPRHIIHLSGERVHENEIDTMIKRLHKRFESDLFFIHSNDTGAIIKLADIERGVYDRYSCVFMTRDDSEKYDAVLGGGEYVTVTYRGDYVRTPELLPKMVEHAKAHRREPAGDALEMYLIDVHESADADEYVTELQLPVRLVPVKGGTI